MRRPVLTKAPVSVAPLPLAGHRAVDAINDRRRQGVRIVLVANGKGGAGKSTLVLNLAIGYGWRRQRVLIVDADTEQQTLTQWPRPDHLDNPTVVCWPTVDVVGRLAGVIDKYDVVLIDMAGRDDRAVASVLDVADILLSPVKPAEQDLLQLGRFIRVARARNVPHLTIFNEATREATTELTQLAEKFARFAPFLPLAMQQLASYRRVYAFGRGVLDISGPDPAKDNFGRIFPLIEAAINKAHARSGMRS